MSCQIIVSDELNGIEVTTPENKADEKTDAIIIGAGPVGLFAVHQLGIKGLKAVVIDNLDKAGVNVLNCIQINQSTIFLQCPSVLVRSLQKDY